MTHIRKQNVEEALDELEQFFIADWGAGDWHKNFPRFFHIHFDICRNKMGLKPKHHPRIVKNVEKMAEVFEKASNH